MSEIWDSVAPGWEADPVAGPLASALAGMEADVRAAIAERAMQSGTKAAATEGDGLVFEGSVLIGSGHKAAP